jgi:hypothetical protein
VRLAIILVVGWFPLTLVGTGIELSGTLQKLIRPAFFPAGGIERPQDPGARSRY